MSDVAERLRRLRRDIGVQTSPPSVVSDGASLDRLRKLVGSRRRMLCLEDQKLAGEEIFPGVRYVEGNIAYAGSAHITLPFRAPYSVRREDILCFDTETTGLTRGVGTRAFMIGVANIGSGHITTRQLYLTKISGEKSMLEIFSSWILPETILFSFNGRSYDAPLLKGRYRLNRLPHRLDAAPHLDWIYTARRAYKDKLENCRLATIEKEILHLVRSDDLPGSQAPAAWLSYLRSGSSAALLRVLEHNRQDVVSVCQLADRLSHLSAVASK